MLIDEGAYLVMRAASGAFSCKEPRIPNEWNPVDRPHVALLLPSNSEVFRVFLSSPPSGNKHKYKTLNVKNLEAIPSESVIEVRHAQMDFKYYRRDRNVWTKIAEAKDPFLVEIFTHGFSPIIINTVEQACI